MLYQQEGSPGWLWSLLTPVVHLSHCGSWFINSVQEGPISLPLQHLAEGLTIQTFFLLVWLTPVLGLLILFRLFILPVPQKEAPLFPLQVNDFSMALGRQVLCTGGLDIQQRCYKPCQPIPAHARTGGRVPCWWRDRQTGKAGGHTHLTYTHCSFNKFDTNYFYKFFQVS